MDATPEVIKALDELAQERFRLEAEKQRIDTAYKVDEARLKAAYAHRIASVSERIAGLDTSIWQLVQQHRPGLIKAGKQSFAIASATFQFRTQKAKLVPTNPSGIMKVARRLGIVRQIADPPVHTWTFNKQRFLAWLESHVTFSRYFQQYMELTDAGESLSVKPNAGHPVFHDKERLTPYSFTIKKS